MTEDTITRSAVPVQSGGQRPQATREVERYLLPAVDIYETDEGLTIVADLPGVEKHNLDVRVEDDVLTIRGQISHPQRANPAYEEYDLLNYFRQFHLNEEVDQEKIQAETKHGVLTLHVPKSERTKPTRIEVEVKQ